jgi:uncharacterized protein YjiS (DUF1127 family)
MTELSVHAELLHQIKSGLPRTSMWRLIQRWAERRAQRQALLALADEKHLLNDIGVTRTQAVREAAKPFWQV